MSGDDFVPEGSPSGWYVHPSQEVDFFWTGRGFASVQGEHVRRRHRRGTPDYEAAPVCAASEWVRQFGVDSTKSSMPSGNVVTLDHLPGHRIVEVYGVVTEIESASGWTASSKGNAALDRALQDLVATAEALGANAIVGFSAATFGAHGGITSGMGGDAVGVLLSGTAVLVVQDPGWGQVDQ